VYIHMKEDSNILRLCLYTGKCSSNHPQRLPLAHNYYLPSPLGISLVMCEVILLKQRLSTFHPFYIGVGVVGCGVAKRLARLLTAR
jgi:hypothetical protein